MSATTGLIVESLRMLHKTVSVLSNPQCGTAMRAAGTSSMRVASWRTKAASSRSEFASIPL